MQMKTHTAQSLHDSPFLQLLCSHAARVIQETVPDGASIRNKAGFIRPLTAQEYHTRWTLTAAGELLNVCDQMEFASQLLSGYRSKPNGDPFISRFDYVRYQIENHVLRTGMVVDRALQLVNVIFDLGIPSRECKFSVIGQNFHVESTGVAKTLHQLQKSVQPIQTQRNVISHRESYQNEGLYEVELHSVLQKSSKRDDESVLLIAANLAKPKADAFIRSKRMELKSTNSTVFECVANLLESLVQPYKLRYQILKNAI
jgi:hypothetical protein